MTPPLRKLMQHQVQAKLFVRQRTKYKDAGQAGLFLAPGTGKTLAAIRVNRPPNLVICRRDDVQTWRSELGMEEVTSGQIEFVDSGNHPAIGRSLETDVSPDIRWWFITYDLMRNPRIYDWVRKQPFRTVYADESHTVKNWGAKRTKAIIRATRHIHRRIAMTGTPITQEIMDVWSQCMFIDNGRTFGDNPWRFRLHYYVQNPNFPGWFPKQGAKAEIQSRLKRIAIHVHEDDVLKLPPIRAFSKAAPISGMQKRMTEQVLNEWEVYVKNHTIELNHTIVQLQKLKQIASGFLYNDDEDRKPVYLTCYKMKLLLDLLHDKDYFGNKKKVVVWGSYNAELHRISALMKEADIKHVRYYGSYASPEKRVSFRDDSSIRVFLGQVDRGVGMNELVVADTAIYHSNSYRIVSRQQSLRRIRRKGSERHRAITYCDLVTEQTIEPDLLASVTGGVDFAKSITDALKRGNSVRSILSRG